ncbi:MAG TPA: tripartite tricarboxylate transporter substrate binding protein [Burkholderiales bacterium]|nr:tripartite tricarboxylate transporter substrate binding protein [Burkholderiales bacterium]
MHARLNLMVLLCAACALAVYAGAHAQPLATGTGQAYPAKTVRVIIPWPTGGLTDVAGRLYFQKMSQALGQQFVIDNRPGASGTIGADIVAKLPADGYTLMVHSTTHVANPHLMAKLPYDTLRDFTAVGLLCAQVGLLVVHPALPVKNIQELIAFAKVRPDQLLYASAGNGSYGHLTMAQLNAMTGTRMVQVPYKGGAQAVTSLISGETQLFISSPAAVQAPLACGDCQCAHASRLQRRALAVTAGERLARLPDIPTIAEAGVPGYDMNSWVGAFAPAGLPKNIVDFVNAEIKKVMDAPDMKSRLEMLDPWYMTPQQMAARVKVDYEKFGKLIRMTGVKAE